MIAFGALSGGVASELSGGNFWEGAITGGIVAGLNHAMHKLKTDNGDPNPNRNWKQDKKLTEGEIRQLKEKYGWDHSDKGKGGGKQDLYKDKYGNIYEKPKGGSGPGNWTNMKLMVPVKTSIWGEFKNNIIQLFRFGNALKTGLIITPFTEQLYKSYKLPEA